MKVKIKNNALGHPINYLEKANPLIHSRTESTFVKSLKICGSQEKIAENLFISPNTVRKHFNNIYKKLQVSNKVEAIQKAKKHNIL